MNDTNGLEYQREVVHLRNDKKMTERALMSQRNEWNRLLNGSLGKDMEDVLSGKKKVKLSFKERLNYKIKLFKNKLRKLFLNNDEYNAQQQ